ncbi:sugar transferase [Polynucleobacter paneuropaeus]|nr:sugar transferase [Polynucleobacter paneuropaeus]MBT8555570.1 sugar transferase [Polynucleobacter paneuropaeus]MBT8560846.1 sugar transferase [Polynucleobacter paneuropaeus]
MFRLHLKRSIDLALSVIAGTILIIPGIMVAILIKLTSPGPILYWSTRIGKGNQLFKMPKFRSMRIDAPEIPSHLMANHAQNFLTPIGPFLRKSSLDELPQLWSIFKGDMSFVGPRPALFNQDDLIFGRKGFGIDVLKPGLTGWAQVNGRDEIGLEQKLQYDAEYLQRQSFRFDIYILWLTLLRVVRRDGISH